MKVEEIIFSDNYKKLFFQIIIRNFEWAELLGLSNGFESIRNCFRLKSLGFSLGNRAEAF